MKDGWYISAYQKYFVKIVNNIVTFPDGSSGFTITHDFSRKANRLEILFYGW